MDAYSWPKIACAHEVLRCPFTDIFNNPVRNGRIEITWRTFLLKASRLFINENISWKGEKEPDLNGTMSVFASDLHPILRQINLHDMVISNRYIKWPIFYAPIWRNHCFEGFSCESTLYSSFWMTLILRYYELLFMTQKLKTKKGRWPCVEMTMQLKFRSFCYFCFATLSKSFQKASRAKSDLCW